MYAGDRQACKADITSRNMLCLMSAVAEKAQSLRNLNQPELRRGNSMRQVEKNRGQHQKEGQSDIKQEGFGTEQ